MSSQQTIELLKMYNKPEIWGDNNLYDEVELALDKFLKDDSTLIERECFVLGELTRGLLDVIETTLEQTTDEAAKTALLDTVVGVLQFLENLDNKIITSKH